MLILNRVFVFFHLYKTVQMKSHPLIDPRYDFSRYCSVDLSISNSELGNALKDSESCQRYLQGFLKRNNKEIAFGGYLERRGLYEGFDHFSQGKSEKREYHLGLDIWGPAGTSVHAPWSGRLHSWANRTTPGDYGPVLILEHQISGDVIYSLFGHLSNESLTGMSQGREFRSGERLGSLGAPNVNGGYAPHLHFQLIRDLGGALGDYPGVCTKENLEYYRNNCPNPLEFLDFGE